MIYCTGCEADVETEVVTGATIYPRRPDLKDKKFHRCVVCHNYVGCHSSGEPLGVIPTPELRDARKHIHELIDPLWKSGVINRRTLYRKISSALGYTFHTADIRSIQEARYIYMIGRRIRKELL